MPYPFKVIREEFTFMRRNGKSRQRDIADRLGISEGTLIAAHAGIAGGGNGCMLRAIRLRPNWREIVESLEPLGEVMALTRNASCVNEKVGVYREVCHNGDIGLVLGHDIDLRIFYQHWAHGFAVTESMGQGTRRSLQFFDAAGNAVHKIFLRPKSDVQAYARLVARFVHENQQAREISDALESKCAEVPDAAIDVEGFRAAWSSLRDTHDFFKMLGQFGVSRTQGLRLADPRYAQRVETDSVHQIIEAAARQAVSIMVFVGNPGLIQIHTGLVCKVVVKGPWINVLDPGFNLHLREDRIASAWVVKKPTVDGLVTSLEAFDKHGETIAMFFGERKPGKPEQCRWRALIEDLQRESSTCMA